MNDLQGKPDTRERIFASAQKLFTHYGLEGTSVRKIADDAKVNIAAINYHFNNKQNLYHEILDYGFIFVKTKIKELAESKNYNFSELILEILKMFIDHQDFVLSCFKMMISEPVAKGDSKDHKNCEHCQKEEGEFGPPGSDVLVKYLSDELKTKGLKVDVESKMWAVRVIFSQMIHNTLMMASPHCRNCDTMLAVLNRDNAIKGLNRLTKAILDSFKV